MVLGCARRVVRRFEVAMEVVGPPELAEAFAVQAARFAAAALPRGSPGEEASGMTQPLRYAINVTLDGCVHHEAGLPPDEQSMAFWTDELRRSDTLLYGRATYELMEGAWRRPESGEWPDWMEASEVAFSEVMDPMRKVVASGTLDSVDWNAELVRGDLIEAVRRLKGEPGRGFRSVA